MREVRKKMDAGMLPVGNEFLDREFEISGTREHDLAMLLEEVNDRTHYQVVDPDDITIISIVRSCSMDKGQYAGEKAFCVIQFMPGDVNLSMLMPRNPQQVYFQQKKGNYGVLPFSYLKKKYGMTDSQISEVWDTGYFFSYDDGSGEEIYIPSAQFMPDLCRMVCRNGTLQPGIDPFRDLYLAHMLQKQDPFLMVSRNGKSMSRAFGCFSEHFIQSRQTVVFDFLDRLREEFPVGIRQWRFTHEQTTVDFLFTGEHRMFGRTRVSSGVRLTVSDTGHSAYTLQNTLYLNGGTVICDELTRKRHQGTLDVDELVTDYLEGVRPALLSHFKELEEASGIPVPDLKAALSGQVSSMKMGKVLGKKRAGDYQEKFFSGISSGPGTRQQVMLEILKVPGYLSGGCDGYMKDAVCRFPSGVFR